MGKGTGTVSAGCIALLTPRGRGAVATLLFHGDCRVIDGNDGAFFQAVNGRPVADQPLGRIVFGKWSSGAENIAPEEIVLCRRSQEKIEIHCHGGDVAAARILNDLVAAGCRVQSWQEQLAGSAGLLKAEESEVLAKTRTLRTAGILTQQCERNFRPELESLLTRDSADPAARSATLAQIDDWLTWSNFGLHLTQPWRVVLMGRPNVGKSSLINALLGHSRSIVFDEPGTTRDVVTAETAFAGWPVELADTAGLRERTDSGPKGDLEAAGIESAKKHLQSADCRLLVLDLSGPLTSEDHTLLTSWPTAIVVGNKVDLVGCRARQMPIPMISVSARTGVGLGQLIDEIVKRLVPRLPDDEQLIPFTERQIRLLSQSRDALAREAIDEFQNGLRTILS